MDDQVNHPKHYNQHPSGVECIDVVEHFSFNRGNAIKYLWRAGDKGNLVQDLEKAIWYIQREIDNVNKAAETSDGASGGREDSTGDRFFTAHRPTDS